MARHKVAIVTPIYKDKLTEEEQVSFKHLMHYLGRYDKYLVMPNSLNVEYKDFRTVKFPNRYFRSKSTYNKLMIWKEFYNAFIDYEYILIYQLDALVFSDKLVEWCDKEYDYIGAPWQGLQGTHDFDSVGNGGFSLRNVQNSLKVLDIHNKPLGVCANFFDRVSYRLGDQSRYHVFGRGKPFSEVIAVDGDIPCFAEDLFWSFKARKLHPAFRIPSAETALSFSFESSPQLCFEKNNRMLPFGCHAWSALGRDFWQQYLVR